MPFIRKILDGMTAATIAVVVIATGAAAFAVVATGSSPAPVGVVATETTATVAVQIGGRVALPVADIGLATLDRTDAGLVLVSATADPGWQVVVEVASGRQLEVSFRSDGVRHDLNVELDNGQLQVRVRTTEGGLESFALADTSSSSSSSSSSSTSSTSSTIPGSSSSSSSTSSTIPGGSTSSTSSTSSTTLPAAPSGSTPLDVEVLDAGSVSYVVDGSILKIVAVSANDGWSSSVERAVSREVEVSFRNGGARVDLNLELEDGQVRVRIRDRRTDTRTETRVPVGGSTSGSTSSTSSTSTIPSSSSSSSTSTSSTIPGSSTTVGTPTQHTVSSNGGSVTVSLSGNTLLLVSTSANPGYSADIRKAGPDRVEVRFESGSAESRIELRVRNGQLSQDVENR